MRLAILAAAAAAACIPNAGLIPPADKWPYEPLAVLPFRDPFTKVANEFGENRIIVLISKESEYGDEDRARFRLMLALSMLLAVAESRELLSRGPLPLSRLKWKSVLARELLTAAAAPCRSVKDGPRPPFKYSALNPRPAG